MRTTTPVCTSGAELWLRLMLPDLLLLLCAFCTHVSHPTGWLMHAPAQRERSSLMGRDLSADQASSKAWCSFASMSEPCRKACKFSRHAI